MIVSYLEGGNFIIKAIPPVVITLFGIIKVFSAFKLSGTTDVKKASIAYKTLGWLFLFDYLLNFWGGITNIFSSNDKYVTVFGALLFAEFVAESYALMNIISDETRSYIFKGLCILVPCAFAVYWMSEYQLILLVLFFVFVRDMYKLYAVVRGIDSQIDLEKELSVAFKIVLLVGAVAACVYLFMFTEKPGKTVVQDSEGNVLSQDKCLWCGKIGYNPDNIVEYYTSNR